MELFHISAECFPVAKVGGLADVVGALPKYQAQAGHEVRVIIPEYDVVFMNENAFETVFHGNVPIGAFNFSFTVHKEATNKLGFELYLIAIPGLFDRKQVYGFQDDIERFLTFQIAALDFISNRDTIPDIINCHDHHTGLIPFMMLYSFKYEKLRAVPTVITIHNGLYQGQFGFEKMNYIPEFDLIHKNVLEWDHCINSLAVAVKCAGGVTTVSPSYLDEINGFANGLESLFQNVRYKSKGILNGIDVEIWNPRTDEMIERNYAIADFEIGKKTNKEKLCSLFNLDATKPLFSFIGRLFDEKGGDLLPDAAFFALKEHANEINIFVLGSGNAVIENKLQNLIPEFKGNFNASIGYNEALAHLVYAGSDFMLMPSRVEPCGLNQMYAMRYGTIPIVRRTGGLRDTVIDFGDDGNGICHDQASVVDICYSIRRAKQLFQDKEAINEVIERGMKTDNSWERVCQEYLEMYNAIIDKK